MSDQSRDPLFILKQYFNFIYSGSPSIPLIPWPTGIKSTPQPAILALSSTHNGVFRVPLAAEGQVDLLDRVPEATSGGDWSKVFRWPNCVDKGLSSLALPAPGTRIECVKCNRGLSSEKGFLLARCLPLPMLSWREGASPWFCGCGAASHRKDDANSHNSAQANPAAPRRGDILYAPGFVVLHPADVEVNDDLDREVMEQELICLGCERSLGIQYADSIQLWDHTVRIFHDEVLEEKEEEDHCENDPTAKTLSDILQACVAESPNGGAKVIFRGFEDIKTEEEEGDTKDIHVSVMAQVLHCVL